MLRIQKHTKFSLKCSSSCSVPSTARKSFSFRAYLTSHLVSLASPLLLVRYLSAIFLSNRDNSSPSYSLPFFAPSLVFSVFCTSFFISLYIPIRTLTRSNSRLHLSRPRSYNSVPPLLFSCVLAHPSEEVSGMKFRVAMSKSSSLQCRPKKHRKFFPHTNKYSFVYCDISHGVQYIVFRQTFLKHVINTVLFPLTKLDIFQHFYLVLPFYNSAQKCKKK